MAVFYYSTKEKRAPGYGCVHAYHRHGGATCQCDELDERGCTRSRELFFDAVSPAKIEIALHALEELEADHAEARKQWNLQLQRADYEVELARRRYEAADPENRLVAAELEALWEGIAAAARAASARVRRSPSAAGP